jgi:hypothetical protein
MEHVQHRQLVSLLGLAEVVAVIGVVARGEQPQPPPATLPGEGEDSFQRGLGDDCEVEVLADVLDGAVELVQKRHAGRAGALLERKLSRLAGLRPGALVAGIAREHEAVDGERIPSGGEQLRQPDVRCGRISSRPLEGIVLGDDAARWQLAARGGHGLHLTPQLDLPLQQPIACDAVFR